ncbi:unnamed protein product [Kluyveromyces dobzhanskii CBS 2104]|uniref:WGS project CCBQ000000000 data, contig 00106 n=1 Tax=Kluyveromyces dobzhanskii CBS 2104 TaxID=1427455 RepID=A0A0A8L837_9SACH|nr:unnamed protein product [Kluyveromyces dobzhanskii CBS 2104]
MSGITFRVPLTSEEKQAFSQHFSQLDKEQLGIVTGESLRPLFSQSGLNPQQLSQIWTICDTDNAGFLNVDQFNAALRMIGHLQETPSAPVTLELYQTPAFKLPSFGQSQRFSSTSTQASIPLPSNASHSVQRVPSVMNRSLGRTDTGSSPAYTVIPVCTPHDFSKFAQLFDRSTLENGVLAGNKAREILMKAKLPTPTLGTIWGLCDRNNSGSLDKVEFVMAMHLIQLTLQQNPAVQNLPTTLPNYLWNSLNSTASSTMSPLSANSTGFSFTSGNGSVVRNPGVVRKPSLSRLPSGTFSNAAVDWTLTVEKKQQFDIIFDSLDKEKKGSLGSNVLVPFFLTSKLGQDVLATVWDLADIHNSPVFTKVEFAIAMFLIQKKNVGIELPDVVPEQLLNSPALGLYQQQSHQQQPQIAVASTGETNTSYQNYAAPVQAQKTNGSALDELLGLNESFTPPPPSTISQSQPPPTSSQTQPLAQTSQPSQPNVRKFRPSSTFGQTMIPEEATKVELQQHSVQQQPQYMQTTSTTAASVGTPPAPPTARNSSLPSVPNFGGMSVPSRNVSSSTRDAVPPASLSQATTELANLSTQVSSLTTQATKVREEKSIAQNELTRISNMKASIESKLTGLRASYDQEVQQTEEIQAQLNTTRTQNEELSQQTAVAEANYHAVQTQNEELQRQLQQAQEDERQLKERLTQFNTLSSQLQQKLAEVQENVKAEKSRVDVHAKQLEVSQVTANNLQTEIQSLEQTLGVYLSKHKELDDYKATIEAQHAEMQNRHKEYLATSEEVQARELEIKSRTAEIENQEQVYREQVARLQELFDDLSKKKSEFESANAEFEKQQYDYADRIQKFSENQMKLAMGEIPDDDYTNDLLQKRSQIQSTQPVEEEEKPESVFDKDIPTPLSQTEPDDEQNQQLEDDQLSQQLQDQQITEDEVAAEAMADSFEGSLNEYGIPRTESVTSSTANNPPQSVRDEVDSEPKETPLPDIDQQLEDSERNDLVKQGSRTAQPTAVGEQLPGGWSTGSTIENDQISDSDSGSIRKTPVLEAQDKKVNSKAIDDDIPAIEDLKLEDAQESLESEGRELYEPTGKNIPSKPDTPEFVNEFEHITHKDLDENVFHDASSTQPFDTEESSSAPVGNDEWDEIFSGLGNGNTTLVSNASAPGNPTPLQHPAPSTGSLPVSNLSKSPVDRGIAVTPKSLAIEELSSMGFSKDEATKALEKCDWDLDDATNLLLDGA